MKPVRVNCVVIDTSVLLSQPSPEDLQKFFEKKLHLDMTLVNSIQLHNVKHVVYIGMKEEQAAKRFAALHHQKHYITVAGKEIPTTIPIYVESCAIDVRLHDLPLEVDTQTIAQHMSQFGEVLTIRSEKWRNFWPGHANGVRVCKMKLNRPIPSYLSIADEITLCSYIGQHKTCKACGEHIHPKLRCSEAAKQRSPSNKSINVNAQCKSSNADGAQSSSTIPSFSNKAAFPALPQTSPVPEAPPAPSITEADDKNKQLPNSKPAQLKRQISLDQDKANKKTSGGNSTEQGEVYTSDSTHAVLIYEELMSTCDLSHIPEEERHDTVIRVARDMAARNERRQQRQKK